MEYKAEILWEVEEYISQVLESHRQTIDESVKLLEAKDGILLRPLSRHLRGKIWELRIEIGNFHHRIFYALAPGKRIILITAFLKKTKKTPRGIIDRAEKILRPYLRK